MIQFMQIITDIPDLDVLFPQLKALGIDNILGFDWLASPAPEAMVRALEVLYSLGILNEDAKLTSPTGFQVAEIPLVCPATYFYLNYSLQFSLYFFFFGTAYFESTLICLCPLKLMCFC